MVTIVGFKCRHCDHLLTYDWEDIKPVRDPIVQEYWDSITCPFCNGLSMLRKTKQYKSQPAEAPA